MVALQKVGSTRPHRPMPAKRELYRERCQDEHGNHYVVIVWQDWPGFPVNSYTLKDGTPVHYEDECVFGLPNGKLISRCEH